jgi:hypothetical protein
MPFALKGIGVAIFTVFQKLGLDISVLPVLEDGSDNEYEYDSEEEEYDIDDNFQMREPKYAQLVGDAFHPIEFLEGGEMSRADKREVLCTYLFLLITASLLIGTVRRKSRVVGEARLSAMCCGLTVLKSAGRRWLMLG